MKRMVSSGCVLSTDALCRPVLCGPVIFRIPLAKQVEHAIMISVGCVARHIVTCVVVVYCKVGCAMFDEDGFPIERSSHRSGRVAGLVSQARVGILDLDELRARLTPDEWDSVADQVADYTQE